LEVPPVPVRSYRKQNNKTKSTIPDFYTTVQQNDIVDVYEIWKLVLNDGKQTEVFIVISAKCNLFGYRKAKWSQVKYRGFYSSIDDAKTEIYTRLA
jgi:hypothetical protein